MGILQNLAKRMSEKKARIKELEQEMRIQKAVEDKMKSANERELESFLKRQHEEKVKRELDKFREKQKKETWQGNNILNQKNIFKGHKSILTDNKKMFKTKFGKGFMK